MNKHEFAPGRWDFLKNLLKSGKSTGFKVRLGFVTMFISPAHDIVAGYCVSQHLEGHAIGFRTIAARWEDGCGSP
jgi:hypothetical protein